MASQQFQLYQCVDKADCDTLIEVVQPASCECACELTCCERPMSLLAEQTADFKTEKHVPVVEEVSGGVRVVVGSTPHPMEPEHWIQFIEVQSGGKLCRQYLQPGDAPEGRAVVARPNPAGLAGARAPEAPRFRRGLRRKGMLLSVGATPKMAMRKDNQVQ